MAEGMGRFLSFVWTIVGNVQTFWGMGIAVAVSFVILGIERWLSRRGLPWPEKRIIAVRHWTLTAILLISVLCFSFSAYNDLAIQLAEKDDEILRLETLLEDTVEKREKLSRLRDFYKEANALYLAVILKTLDTEQLREFKKREDDFSTRLTKWVEDHLGEGALARLEKMPIPPPLPVLDINSQNASISAMTVIKDNIEALIDNPDWWEID